MITLHADVVGSLLRPPELLKAKEELAGGKITAERFREIEDRAVDEAIALQESVGLEVVTDGEMRRDSFQSLAWTIFFLAQPAVIVSVFRCPCLPHRSLKTTQVQDHHAKSAWFAIEHSLH